MVFHYHYTTYYGMRQFVHAGMLREDCERSRYKQVYVFITFTKECYKLFITTSLSNYYNEIYNIRTFLVIVYNYGVIIHNYELFNFTIAMP